ncbi:MAG: hypothetical protein WCF44_05220 [Candidatus Methylophosphatis roskildensis]
MMQSPRSSLEQLGRALEAGAIDQATYDAAVAAIKAQLAGAGAIAQGQDATAVGAGGVAVRGNNSGTINLGVIIQQGTQTGATADDLKRAYLARILLQADQLPLFAGDGGNAQVRLTAVYTALLTQRSDAESRLGRRSVSAELADAGTPHHLSALDVLNTEYRLVLLGGPGSGKSTFVNFVALSMAGELLGLPQPNLASLTATLPVAQGQDQKPKPQQWDHGAQLPVQIVLRDLASQLPAPGREVNADTVWAHVAERLKAAALGDFAPVLRRHLLERGGIVFLDGLDEVPVALDRRE